MPAQTSAPYDLIISGAEAAGGTAACEARGQGARVAMVERWKVGGTCLNAGCDPTKTLHETRSANRFGIIVEHSHADWPAVVGRGDRVIGTIRGSDGDRNIREAGIDLRKGHARLRAPGEVEVAGDVLRGEAVILATGAHARVPPIPGLREAGYITNVEAVALPRLPRSLAILGAGTIAAELAQIFARFGVTVAILGRNPRFLPHEEPELAAILRDRLADEGVRIETGVIVDPVERTGDGKRVVAHRQSDPLEIVAEEILVAAGRAPTLRRSRTRAGRRRRQRRWDRRRYHQPVEKGLGRSVLQPRPGGVLAGIGRIHHSSGHDRRSGASSHEPPGLLWDGRQAAARGMTPAPAGRSQKALQVLSRGD